VVRRPDPGASGVTRTRLVLLVCATLGAAYGAHSAWQNRPPMASAWQPSPVWLPSYLAAHSNLGMSYSKSAYTMNALTPTDLSKSQQTVPGYRINSLEIYYSSSVALGTGLGLGIGAGVLFAMSRWKAWKGTGRK